MGPAFSEITHIAAASATRIEIGFTHPSPLLLEGLEATIQNRPIGTGPFVPVGQNAPNEMRANPAYSLGQPAIDRIVVSPHQRAGRMGGYAARPYRHALRGGDRRA
jgi:MarR-like DNA-binding transcriptional regulator SgrR of sgrS sRNA